MKSNSTWMPVVILAIVTSIAVGDEAVKPPPFEYVWGQAHHILPETHSDESGYFSLCEGLDGAIYVGTAKYGVNSYLVEFDPHTEKQKIVIDTHKVCGMSDTGYAAQAKIHTRNFVGKSGKIYVGSKQGYATEQDKKDEVKYPGGYVMTYDPRTGETASLGMPYKDEGVIDVTADESRGLIYSVTCEEQHWMVYDVKTKEYRELGPMLWAFAMTLVDASGRAVAITKDSQLAQYDPATGKVTTRDIIVNGSKLEVTSVPTWILTPDARGAYLRLMSDAILYEIDLMGQGAAISAVSHGKMIEGRKPDSRCALALSPDGWLYNVIRVDNETGYGSGYLHHLVRFHPRSKKKEDLGVLAVKNPDFFDFQGSDNNKPPWSHGYHTLPDGTLTPLHSHMGLVAANDGALYVTILYPYTLLKIDAFKTPAKHEGPAGQYVDAIVQRCDRAEKNMAEFTRIAEIAAARHIAGGAFTFCPNNQALQPELNGRSGFMMHTGDRRIWKERRSDAEKAQDFGIIGWDWAPGESDAKHMEELRQRGGYVIGFGPGKLPGVRELIPKCDAFFDTGLEADGYVVQLSDNRRAGAASTVVNLMHGWVFSAEFVAALTRRGKAPTIWKSYLYEDGHEYGDRYFKKQQFHDEFKVAPIAPGDLGREVLDRFRYHLRRFKQSQLVSVRRAGEIIATESKEGRKTFVASCGHAPPVVIVKDADAAWAKNVVLHGSDAGELRHFGKRVADGSLVLRLGYAGHHRDTAAFFGSKKYRVLLITAENTRAEYPEPSGYPVIIDMGYAMGDACVAIEGYPVRLFPPSGVMQLTAYQAVNVEVLDRLGE